ncbi:MAG: hypothetical protein JST00_08070 [Deltaproteobacteria bacterium]|nr:hypothetical protein [Deltaproteobacteria bacterium]
MKNVSLVSILTPVFSLLPCVLAVTAACSSSSPASGAPDVAGSCNELASRCHGFATPLAVECHELGHDGDDARCGPRRSECLAACPEGARDAGSEGAAQDASRDAPSDAAPDPSCVAYCSCMSSACASVKNYPFTDVSACYAACATFSAADRACFTAFCGEAADSGAKDHACDHATGKLGSAECP